MGALTVKHKVDSLLPDLKASIARTLDTASARVDYDARKTTNALGIFVAPSFSSFPSQLQRSSHTSQMPRSSNTSQLPTEISFADDVYVDSNRTGLQRDSSCQRHGRDDCCLDV